MRALEDPTLVSNYIETRAAIAELESTLPYMKDTLLQALFEEPGEEFYHSGVKLHVQRIKHWVYDEDIQQQIDEKEAFINQLKNEIKDLKAFAQSHRKAGVDHQQARLMLSVDKRPKP